MRYSKLGANEGKRRSFNVVTQTGEKPLFFVGDEREGEGGRRKKRKERRKKREKQRKGAAERLHLPSPRLTLK